MAKQNKDSVKTESENASTDANEIVTIKALKDINTSKFGSVKAGGKLKVTKAFADCLITFNEAEILEDEE